MKNNQALVNQRKWLIGLTALALISTPVISENHAVAAQTVSVGSAITAVNKIIRPITLTAHSSISIIDVAMMPSDEGQQVAYTLSVKNNGNVSVNLGDYWFRLSNKSGNKYSIKTTGDSKTATVDLKTAKIAPNSTLIFTIYASVGANAKLSDLVLKVVKFDFSVSGYERTIGQIQFPQNFTNNVASTSYKAIYYNSTTLYTKISSASIGQSGEDKLAKLKFVYNNIGKKTATISKFKYYIVTSTGAMYEAAPTDTTDLVLAPLVRKEIEMTVTLPSKVSTTGARLIVTRESGTESLVLPVGEYNIKYTTSSESTTTATDNFMYTTEDGKYEYRLTQLLREPWENQDVLSARIRITNKSANSLGIPNVTGNFLLDNTAKIDFKTVATANQFALNANGYVDIDVYAKIPSNYSFTKAKLVINNKIDDKTINKAGELATVNYLTQIPKYASDKVYAIARDGSQMEAAVNTVDIYNNSVTKVYNVQVTLTSKEKRTIDPIKLVGVFMSDNGDIFPATASTGQGQVNASNKALVNFSANLPQTYDSNNLKLIIGEAVTDTKYTSGTAIAEGYVNAVQFGLPQERSTSGVFNQLSLLPYTLTVNKFTPQVFGDDMQVVLDYSLVKDTTYNVYSADRKLILTLESKNKSTGEVETYFTQELALEGEGAGAVQPGEKKTIAFKKPFENNGGVNGGTEILNTVKLYEVIQGSKKAHSGASFQLVY
ncbi:hypothetical protein [Cohnella rhizosphaerae]|uniref:DUF11 domain-containing protein n=1 Tax=Cohnella rhizosphaerae TaxID=1457232 RepID=A0A9X4QUW8_9BACL|nr:hypothetical protein [Cohnella rhizosphaerae]MDG0811798.1 hypothetical protein [Cohnella rhizosphaerae]